MGIAVAVLILWLAGLASLGHREMFGDGADRLAMAGLLVSPGSDFYMVSRGSDHVGFASFTIDTSETGLELTEYTVFDLERRDGTPVRISRRYRVQSSHALKLQRLQLDEQYGTASRTVIGTVEGDSVLVIEARDEEKYSQERIKLEHPVLPTSAVQLALVLARQPRVGRSYDFAVLDPVEMRPRSIRLRVTAESIMVFADSARYDGGSEQWVAARSDTVRAWRVEQQPAGSLSGWVDEQGRTVHREFDGGLREQRTAYEMAYLNWPGNRIQRASSGARSSDSSLINR